MPQTTHGRYSKALPSRLLATYQTAGEDTELLALREEVQIVDSRIADVLGRVDTGEAGRLWREARQAWRLLKRSSSDPGAAKQYAADLNRALDEGVADYAAWSEVFNLIERRRKLVESERKRMLEAQQYVAVEKALLLVQALADSVKQHVSDPRTLAAIQADLTRLLGTAAYHEAGTGR